MSGRCRIYNQKGELVAEGANILKESFRRYKDPAKRNPDGAHAWESPDWWLQPVHIYTDEDWEYIISIWKKEKVRGADPLYWDEVEIGDEPTPTATPSPTPEPTPEPEGLPVEALIAIVVVVVVIVAVAAWLLIRQRP